jgi:uncharacterized membrane protein YesL
MTNTPQSPPTPRRAPSIAIAFRTLGRTLKHGYENLGTLAISSVLWYAGAIFLLPLGIVTAALHRVTRPMTEERASSWRNFFDHLRPDLRWSSLLAVIVVGSFVVISANISFYNATPNTTLRLVTTLFVGLQIIWIGVALFAFPIALRQEDQSVRRTLRNAVVMTLANLPGVLVSMVLLLLLCVFLLVIPPLFVMIPGVVALWGEENARLLLVASGYLAEDPIADRPRIPK